jgi:GNAT superfamily N-acetyltransferase
VPVVERAGDEVRPRVDLRPYTVGLADGRRVMIRSATPDDLAGVIDFFERMSATSRYLRFFSPQPRLRRAMIERVVATGDDRATVLAQPVGFEATSRHVVAVGGWVDVPAEGRADVSVAVADDWQNVMLGTALVLVLLREAAATGRTRFAADVLSGNVRMLGLLDALGAPLRTCRDAGVSRVEFEIPPAACG